MSRIPDILVKIGLMFSASLEVVLSVSYREAASREHAYLTLEHLLYALAHDPEGEAILAACGANLPQLRADLQDYLESSVEHWKRGHERQPEQTETTGAVREIQAEAAGIDAGAGSELEAGDLIFVVADKEERSPAIDLLAFEGNL